MPYAFSFLGWFWALFLLSTLCAISLYTSWILSQLHEYRDLRLNTYRELGTAIWGKTLGWWAIAPVQYTLMVGLCITYSVTAGLALKGIASSECDGADCQDGIAPWIVLFGIIQLFLSQVPDFHGLWWVSLFGALMSVGYCSVATGASIAAAVSNPEPIIYVRPNATRMDTAMGVLNSVGSIAFTFGGQVVLPEIQATLARPPPTPPTMMRGVGMAYGIVISAYFAVAISGYAAFGATVQPDVLLSIRKPTALIDAANLMVVLHVAAGYQVFGMPLFDSIESGLRSKLSRPPRPWIMRLIVRSIYVVCITFIACLLPFFGDLMGLIASIGLMPITFIIPSLLWISAKKPRGIELVLNVLIALAMTVLAVLAFIGSVRNIVVDAKRYSVLD